MPPNDGCALQQFYSNEKVALCSLFVQRSGDYKHLPFTKVPSCSRYASQFELYIQRLLKFYINRILFHCWYFEDLDQTSAKRRNSVNIKRLTALQLRNVIVAIKRTKSNERGCACAWLHPHAWCNNKNRLITEKIVWMKLNNPKNNSHIHGKNIHDIRILIRKFN